MVSWPPIARRGRSSDASDVYTRQLQRHIYAMDDLDPVLVCSAFDFQALDLQQDIPFGTAVFLVGHSFNPLVLCRNQSTTKFTAIVSKAIAQAGNSGVMAINLLN